jgi:hypothetical protein
MGQYWEKNAVSERGIVARLMQCGFNPGELLATMAKKASESGNLRYCPEIHVQSVRKFALSPKIGTSREY